MNLLRFITRRLLALFRNEIVDTEMSEEMRLHLEMQTAVNIRAGMNAQEAHFAAQREFGGVEQIKERCRDQRRWLWIEQLFQDLRFALRSLGKHPGFTFTVVFTLALGIGANTAIFSVVNGVLLKPLSYREPERLVALLHEGKWPVAPADFLDWHFQNHSFETIAAAEAWGATFTGSEHAQAVPGIRVTQDLFEVFGVSPFLGRTFQQSDFKPGAERVLVLGYSSWQRLFGGDSGIVGRPVTLSNDMYTVVGVMPPEFLFAPFWATRAEMAAPLDLSGRATSRGSNSLRVFARLKRGVSFDQAQAEMTTICRQLELTYPQTNSGRTVRVDSLLDKTVGDVRGSLRFLTAAVFCVLLIACANVANLLLAHSSTRQKEMVVRIALGASRGRIIRQLVTENLVLAGGGSVLGLLVGYFSIGALKALLTVDAVTLRVHMPRLTGISMDAPTLLFALGVSALTGLIFGLVPALQTAKRAQQDALREGGRGLTSSARGRRLRSALVIGEIALALITLIGAGLLLRSFNRLTAINPGFEPHQRLSMIVSVQGQKEIVGEKREAFYQTTLKEIRSLPGCISASATNHLPLAGDTWVDNFRVEGGPPSKPGQGDVAVYRVARPGYFETMGIRMDRGRDFDAPDSASSPNVVIINEQLALKYWPGENPLGRRVTLDDQNGKPNWLTIVGVVKNVRQTEWTREASNEVYVPFLQSRFLLDPAAHFSAMTIVVRTAVDPLTLVTGIQKAIGSVNRDAALSGIATLDQVVSGTLWQPRFNLLLTGLFAGIALLLAAIGLYGVIAYGVAQRTREIGLRLALGATPGGVLGLMLRQGLKLISVGLLLGLVGAFGLTRMLTALIYDVTPTDPGTFAGVSLALLVVALLACWLPARHATKISPAIALLTE